MSQHFQNCTFGQPEELNKNKLNTHSINDNITWKNFKHLIKEHSDILAEQDFFHIWAKIKQAQPVYGELKLTLDVPNVHFNTKLQTAVFVSYYSTKKEKKLFTMWRLIKHMF